MSFFSTFDRFVPKDPFPVSFFYQSTSLFSILLAMFLNKHLYLLEISMLQVTIEEIEDISS